jgi:nondiscriminating aspartyl-tRNA synthetase
LKKRVLIENLKSHMDTEVTIAGWVHSIRSQGKITFVLIRDRTGIAQVVSEDLEFKNYDLRNETVVFVTGTVKEDSRAETGLEMRLSRVISFLNCRLR